MAQLRPPVSERDHVQGPATAAVTLVEYGDFQCPHCGRAHPIIKAIQARMGSRLRFVYRNFPLSESHPRAVPAALAAEAAGIQGRFWEMHDLIFENQRRLSGADFEAHATQLGLDIERFRDDMASEAVLARVEGDFESGVRSGVSGTPGLFIDGDKYDGPWDEATLARALGAP